MGRVVDLERERVEQLAVELVPVLRERGGVVADATDLDDVDRWRRAARRAGRLLGWSMRTGVSGDGRRVWATSDDWPLPPGEQRRAAERVTQALHRGER